MKKPAKISLAESTFSVLYCAITKTISISYKKILRLNFLFVFLSVILFSCFPRQRKIHFDKDTMKVSLCEPGSIDKIQIDGREIGNYSTSSNISKITALTVGSKSVSLIDYNPGYDSIIGIERLLPNFEYQIIIPHLDANSEILLYTNSIGEIDSVINLNECE